MTNAINSSFAWRCASPINDKKITVAVWDMHSHALNFGESLHRREGTVALTGGGLEETPCGNNGWNLNNEDFCNDGVDYAALCLKPEGASCLYMWRQDDCRLRVRERGSCGEEMLTTLFYRPVARPYESQRVAFDDFHLGQVGVRGRRNKVDRGARWDRVAVSVGKASTRSSRDAILANSETNTTHSKS